MRDIPYNVYKRCATHLDLAPEKAQSLYLHVARCLKQLKLKDHHDPIEVFDEIFRRREKTIKNGNVINHPLGWAKATSYHFLMEEKAKINRAYLVDPKIIEDKSSVDNAEIKDENIYLSAGAIPIVFLEEALQELTSKERATFLLKYEHELSWKEVAAHVGNGSVMQSASTVRQQGYQIKRKLWSIISDKISKSASGS